MICMVVGTRPNFMKMAPVILEAKARGIKQIVVHTGQHYDAAMSKVFFEELGMPEPDIDLGVGSGTHADQTARIMIAFEKVCVEHKLSLVVVAGDVNSTVACGLVAAKLLISVAHLEAGLRSFDRTMPEEINRILTDHLSEILFTSEPSGNENLLKEGIAREKIHFVGNCMIDSLRRHLDAALSRSPWQGFGLEPQKYALLTLHRPAMVNDLAKLDDLRNVLREIAGTLPILFPIHPRTRKKLEEMGKEWSPVKLIDPLGYLDFLGLMAKARIVLTDSGGVQEETTVLGVPCITMRDNTERPVTITQGTNQLAGTDARTILVMTMKALDESNHIGRIPELWDGFAAVRVIDSIETFLKRSQSAKQVVLAR